MTVIRTVHNNLTYDITLFVPGYDAKKSPVVVPVSGTLDLFTVVTAEQLSSMQDELAGLVADGALSAVALADSVVVSMSGAAQGTGVLIGYKDNAACLRVRGPQHVSEGGLDIQSYSGIYYNDSYDTNGLLKTRFISGGNEYADVEIQSSNALLLSAVGENLAGFAKIAARTNVIFNVRDEADQDSPKQLIIDRVDTGTVGAANTSDVNIKVNAGNLRLLAGNVTGAVVLPLLTDAERGALTPVKGMLIMNADTSLLNVYDGSAWKAVDVSAV